MKKSFKLENLDCAHCAAKFEEALKKIEQPAYDEETIAHEFEYIAKKLDLTVFELKTIMQGENKTYRDYRNSMKLISLGTNILRLTGIQRAIIR